MDTSFGADQLVFLLQGLRWTLAIGAVAFVTGGIVGLAVALARTADRPALRRWSGAYVAAFQGTPLLMQLFVVYYGIALLNISLDAWVAVTVAYTLHASAFLGEIWRGGIDAIPKGQTEAAKALGIHYGLRMWKVILPQAFRISLPSTVGFLVQLLKGTSLAAIVGFIELARAGQIVSNQTYRPLMVFGIVGVIYFLICWPISLYGSHLERRHATSSR